MKRKQSKEQHDIRRDSRNFQRGNTPEQRLNDAEQEKKALAETLGINITPRIRAEQAAEILYEEFGKDFNVLKNEDIRTYHIAKKDVVMQLTGAVTPVEGKRVVGEGKMIVTVTHDGTLNISLNSDEGDRVYQVRGLTNTHLLKEIAGLKAFIADNTALPSTSKFLKQEENEKDHKKYVDKRLDDRRKEKASQEK